MKLTEKNVNCIYCGVARADTTEHVVTKSFFPKPRPSDLWTVPACRDCNISFQKDEDYFWATVMFGPAGVSEVGKRLWIQLDRAYEKNRGLRNVIARSLHQTDLQTPAGLIIPNRMAIDIDHKRVGRVIAKIVRGLYYCEYCEPLGADTECPFSNVRSSRRREECVPDSHWKLASDRGRVFSSTHAVGCPNSRSSHCGGFVCSIRMSVSRLPAEIRAWRRLLLDASTRRNAAVGGSEENSLR